MSTASPPNGPSAIDAVEPPAATTESDASGRALLIDYSYTGQARRMSDAMADELRAAGVDVTQAAVAFTDRRYVDRFKTFPMHNAFLDVLRMLPAQVLRRTGEIQIPPEAQSGDYDLVCVLSPTWWLTTNMPTRSFLKAPSTDALLRDTMFTDVVVCRRYWGNNHRTVRKLGMERGGTYVEGIHFAYAGGQVRSLLSLISYLGSGDYRERYLGLRIPKTNLTEAQLDDGRAFARRLATHIQTTASARRED